MVTLPHTVAGLRPPGRSTGGRLATAGLWLPGLLHLPGRLWLHGLLWCLLQWSSTHAHEGHKPLPTRGMEINADTGRMILTRAARKSLDVQTAEVGPQTLTQSILAYGTLVSPWQGHSFVSSQLPGRIVELAVQPGESVRAGQLLARLDSPELQRLQLEIRNAQLALELSQKVVDATEAASRTGVVPETRLMEVRNQVAQNRVAVEIARAKWLGLQLPVETLEAILRSPRQTHQPLLSLTSPLDGIVTHSDLSVGKVVSSQEHLFELLDLSTVWLRVDVLEKDLARVSVGQALELSLAAYPGESFEARVDVVGQALDQDTHLGTVWATLSNPPARPPRLLPGMSGQVQLKAAGTSQSVVVPLSAVLRDGAERFVLVEEEYTLQASVYQKQTVTLGLRMGDLIEVRGGRLFPGDRVVTQGSHQLGGYFTKGVLRVNPETAQDIGLQLQPAAAAPLADTLTVDGRVEVPPTQRTLAAAQLSGTLAEILVDRGQQVRAGEVLAHLASQEFQDLQLELLRAHLEAELQQQTLQNLGEARDAVSQRRLWEVESGLQQLLATRESIGQRLQTAGLSAEQLQQLLTTRTLQRHLPLRAPMDGVVIDFSRALGQVVQPEEPVFEIHDLSHVWVQAFVPESDASRVHAGQSVRVRLVADAAAAIPGTLVRSSQAIGSNDRTLAVWVELQQQPRLALQHNLLARVTIETGRVSSPLAVPHAALVREGTRAFVFVHTADDTFERRPVRLGRADDLAVEILGGLTSGEVVAVGGASALQTGYAALR